MSKATEQEANGSSKPELWKWEFDEMKRWFKYFDKNGDGKLNKKELLSVIKAKCWTFSDKDIDEIFKKAGKDELDTEDYEKFLSTFRKEKEAEKTDLLRVFKKLDPDHKGYITKRQIFDFFMDDDIPDLPEIIKKADVEKNGKIDLNDFVLALLED